jgi:hypothetical protein
MTLEERERERRPGGSTVLLSTIAVSFASTVVGATVGRRLEALDASLWDGGEDPDADQPPRAELPVPATADRRSRSA